MESNRLFSSQVFENNKNTLNSTICVLLRCGDREASAKMTSSVLIARQEHGLIVKARSQILYSVVFLPPCKGRIALWLHLWALDPILEPIAVHFTGQPW